MRSGPVTIRRSHVGPLWVVLVPVLLACDAEVREGAPTPRVMPSTVAAIDHCEGINMEIQFERSGGIAGMTSSVKLRTDSLPEAESKELCKLVEDAGFFGLPASTGPAPGADMFNYRVTITDGARTHTVQTNDGTAPPALIPLLDRLSRAARKR